MFFTSDDLRRESFEIVIVFHCIGEIDDFERDDLRGESLEIVIVLRCAGDDDFERDELFASTANARGQGEHTTSSVSISAASWIGCGGIPAR